MPGPIITYVRFIDKINRIIGRAAMYLVFAMMGILLLSSISRTMFGVSFLWIVVMAQFTMVSYYLLGGGYSMQLDSHVRMDLLYGRWSSRRKAFADAITVFCLIFYLSFLLYGGISSTTYALEYGQKHYSAWAPYLAPIKIIMTFGIVMMLLQAVATFFKNVADVKGAPIA